MATPPHDTRPHPVPSTDGDGRSTGGAGLTPAGDGDRPHPPAGPGRPGPARSSRSSFSGSPGPSFVGGIIAQWLGSGTPPPATATVVRQAKGSPLRAEAGHRLLKPVIVAGQPPRDVVDAVVVPVGTTSVAGSAQDRGVESYDRSLGLRVGASQAVVVAFYRAELRAEGWSQISTGAPSGAERAPAGSIEVLAKRGASDGNFWEIGTTVAPTAFVQTRNVTPFTLRLFVVSDQN